MFGNLVGRKPVVRPIIQVGGQPFRQAVRIPVAANAINDVVAAAPFAQHFADHFGRILKVDVDRDHGIPRRMIEPRRKRCLLPEVARQRNAPHPGIGGIHGDDRGQRGIAAAVVDEQDFPCLRGRIVEPGQNGGHAVYEGRNRVLFILDRHDDRESRALCVHFPPDPSSMTHDG